MIKLKTFRVEGRVRCTECDALFRYEGWYATCPHCGAQGIVTRPEAVPVKMEPLSDLGDLMTFAEFAENVKSGGFIDYDGFGHYATKTEESNLIVRLEDFHKDRPDRRFTHVVWFNR